MSNTLRILFAPLDSTGHINACIAVAQSLRARGHTIIFAIESAFRSKLAVYGFQEELYFNSGNNDDASSGGGEFWSDFMGKLEEKIGLSPIEKAKEISVSSFEEHISLVKCSNDRMRELIARNTPDVIVVDNYVCTPAIINSGVPWVLISSCNPLFHIDDDRTPPIRSGLPINGDKTDWIEFRRRIDQLFHSVWSDFNEWAVSEGLEPLPQGKFITSSPYLNLYGFAREIDYTNVRPLPNKWFQLDGFFRRELIERTNDDDEPFEIPEPLNSKPGKLVYLSLGSMGSSFVIVMKRLISILSKSTHKFIVVKGPHHREYSLPDNMWGESFLPQTKILPLVDLVITHGGANTLAETLYFGKPMIVLPLFFDQLDNAQRVEESGFAIRLHPTRCGESDLLTAVDRLVNDRQLTERLRAVSKRIQSSNSMERAAQLIENLVA